MTFTDWRPIPIKKEWQIYIYRCIKNLSGQYFSVTKVRNEIYITKSVYRYSKKKRNIRREKL